MGDEPSGVSAYAEFAKDELEIQEKRKASFEQRGVAVITTSGAIVTLLFALAALSTKREASFVLPSGARTWLLIALALFVIAGVCALLTNIPLKYEAVEADDLRSRLKEEPVRSLDAALKDIGLTRVKALRSAKDKNTTKGRLLVAAMLFEVVAVGCVARAIGMIL